MKRHLPYEVTQPTDTGERAFP